eukprot:8771372-Pyramimonas_sp.AAC.1
MKFSETKRMGTVFNRSSCVDGPQKVQWPYNQTAAKLQFDMFDVPFRRSFKVNRAERPRVPPPSDPPVSDVAKAPKPPVVIAPAVKVPGVSPDKKAFLSRSQTAPVMNESCRWDWLPLKEVWRQCHTCRHEWLDKYRKDECPKCLLSLDPAKLTSFSPQVRLKPSDARQSVSGNCVATTEVFGYPMPHVWKYGKCNLYVPALSPLPSAHLRGSHLPTLDFRSHHQQGEVPESSFAQFHRRFVCSQSISLPDLKINPSLPGCDSTHSCGLDEGVYFKRDLPPAAYPNSKRTMCTDGKKHTFKFTVCTKCGERDFDLRKSIPDEGSPSRPSTSYSSHTPPQSPSSTRSLKPSPARTSSYIRRKPEFRTAGGEQRGNLPAIKPINTTW